jgi:hypothetical protein
MYSAIILSNLVDFQVGNEVNISISGTEYKDLYVAEIRRKKMHRLNQNQEVFEVQCQIGHGCEFGNQPIFVYVSPGFGNFAHFDTKPSNNTIRALFA